MIFSLIFKYNLSFILGIYKAFLSFKWLSLKKDNLAFYEKKYNSIFSLKTEKYFSYISHELKAYFVAFCTSWLFIFIILIYLSRYSFSSFLLDYTIILNLGLLFHFFIKEDKYSAYVNQFRENNLKFFIWDSLIKVIKLRVKFFFWLVFFFFVIKYNFFYYTCYGLYTNIYFSVQYLLIVFLHFLLISLFFRIISMILVVDTNHEIISTWITSFGLILLSFIFSNILIKSIFVFLENSSFILSVGFLGSFIWFLFLIITYLYQDMYWK